LSAFIAIVEGYQQVLTFLNGVFEDNITNAGATAIGLANKMYNLKFLFLINMLEQIFQCTNILSKCCQDINNTVQNILDQALTTILRLGDFRDNFDIFYNKIKDKARDCNFDEQSSNKRGRLASNVLTEDKLKQMFFETINLFITEITDRFNKDDLNPIISIYNILTATELGDTNVIEKDLNIYNKVINSKMLITQLELFYKLKKIKNIKNFKDLIGLLRANRDFRVFFKSSYSEICILLRIYLTCPIANVTAERAFSCLKRIKTYLRSTIGQDRLSSLAVLNIENEYINLIDLDAAIDEFANIKNRRIKFF
jgi:hypothetical protein